MPGSASLLGFVAAALVVLLIPGPAVLFVVSRSISQGRRAGLLSVLGLSTGALVHVAAATLGLSALLVASAAAFRVVKTLGAGYLIYLGARALLDRQPAAVAHQMPLRSMHRLFVDGVIVSLLNPKIAVFFLAFLPQFVQPARGRVPQQVFVLGLVYVALALCTDGTYALIASGLRPWLGSRGPRERLTRYATGVIYIGLGIGTAFVDRH